MKKTSLKPNNSTILNLDSELNQTQEQITKIFQTAIVFDIELLNGVKSSVTTICNHTEVDMDEIVAYMSDAIKKSNKVKAMTPTAGSICGGEYEPIFFYDRTEFDRSAVLNNPNLRKAYGI